MKAIDPSAGFDFAAVSGFPGLDMMPDAADRRLDEGACRTR